MVQVPQTINQPTPFVNPILAGGKPLTSLIYASLSKSPRETSYTATGPGPDSYKIKSRVSVKGL